MSHHINRENSELFIDLSGQEQEAASGGSSPYPLDIYDFYFHKKDVVSFANIESNISNGDISVSSKQQSGYMLSELSFGFSLGARRSSRRSSGSSLDLSDILSVLLSSMG
jgi:hypothetical protein